MQWFMILQVNKENKIIWSNFYTKSSHDQIKLWFMAPISEERKKFNERLVNWF